MDLSVTVDGSEGAALAPFRFIVIDDPVQSMDPARVDGLARVLESAARSRQVVVFTHDDRLASAVHRLDIEATVMEVTRREKSLVELRIAKDPVTRYIDDAIAVAMTDSLPPLVARRVIPGICRHAIEAACMESVRRRRLGRGEPHLAIEDLLAGAAFRWCNEGAHETQAGPLVDQVRGTEKLAHWLRGRA